MALKHLWYKNTYCSTGFTNLMEYTAIPFQIIPSVVRSTEQGECKASVPLVVTCSYIQKCTLLRFNYL